ncbi:hypothetical protein [Streptomyces sp. NPDC015680]|uniref:hypothetical protein n=1 Tax=Streptomyces sp. NPDC015680 TaxID=3364962 RepID=UPI0036FE2AE9
MTEQSPYLWAEGGVISTAADQDRFISYVWGKTGSRPGWDNGFFATHDPGHRIVYSLNPTGAGNDLPYIKALVDAASCRLTAGPSVRTGAWQQPYRCVATGATETDARPV